MATKRDTVTDALQAQQHFQEKMAIPLDAQVMQINIWQRTLLRFLVEYGNPASTAKIRTALIEKLCQEIASENESFASAWALMKKTAIKKNKSSLTQLMRASEKLLKKYKIKVVSYNGLETDLANLTGYIFKKEETGRNNVGYWVLNVDFVSIYLQRKQELARELAANPEEFYNAHPRQVGMFYGVGEWPKK